MKIPLLKMAIGTVVFTIDCHAVMDPNFKLSMPDSERITMPDFEISLYRRNIKQLYDIASKSALIAFGVDSYTEDYRVHMWRVRNNTFQTQQEAKMAHYENADYGWLVYNVIPTELIRCLCNIAGGKFEYTDNYDDILYYKGAENLTEIPRFMFERIVLANIFNRINNKPYTDIKEAANEIVKAVKESNATVDKYAPTIWDSFSKRVEAVGKDIQRLSEAIHLQILIGAYSTAKGYLDRLTESELNKYYDDLIRRSTGDEIYTKLNYLPGKLALRYCIKTKIRPGQLPKFAPLTPESIEIIDGSTSDKKVISYTGIEKRIIQEGQIPTDDAEIINKLTSLKMNYATLLWQKLKEKKYNFNSIPSKAGYARDLKLYTLLDNIGYYESVSIAGIPDIRYEKGEETSSESTKQRMIRTLRNKLTELLQLIYTPCEPKEQNTLGKQLSKLIRKSIDNRIKALKGQHIEFKAVKAKLLPKIPMRFESGESMRGEHMPNTNQNLIVRQIYFAETTEIKRIDEQVKRTSSQIMVLESLREQIASQIDAVKMRNEEYKYSPPYKYIDDWFEYTVTTMVDDK